MSTNEKPLALVKAPTLKKGDDSAAAKQLLELYEEAQNGMRRVVAFGLCCFQIKEQLPHGKFMPWLAANCPAISGRSARAHMQLTAGALKACGVSVGGFIKMADAANLPGGNLLLLPENKVPEKAMPLRKKMCDMIDGKTQKQLFLEFKQSEDDGDGVKAKKGRLKGQGGASREQRLSAAERKEQERMTAVELDCVDLVKLIDELCDDKNLGLVDPKTFKKVAERSELLRDYIGRVTKMRKAS